jgi:hypothetical protein
MSTRKHLQKGSRKKMFTDHELNLDILTFIHTTELLII